jgi:CheY-like chemotaxis protein/HPt (histidine-containing phosphotransfer) domain-containing protein
MNKKTYSLLLIEDNLVSQILVKNIIDKLGYEILIADNGQEALYLLDNHKFDLILMDIEMPIMNGIDTTRLIRDKEKSTCNHIPIIAMTAYSDNNKRDEFHSYGMDDYILKPIQSVELYKIINQYLQKKQSQNIILPFDIKAALEEMDADINFFLELVNILEGEYQTLLTNLRESLEKQDYEQCRKTAHYLKTSLGSLRAKKGYEISHKIEIYSKNKEHNLISTLLGQLDTEIKNIIICSKESNLEEFL